VRDQVSHPYSTTGKITVLYILIFSFLFLIWDGKTKDFRLMIASNILNRFTSNRYFGKLISALNWCCFCLFWYQLLTKLTTN
jgi:hypothetical protein